MQLDHVVVGVDFSPASMAAATWVATHFAPEGTVVLAHAIAVPEPPPILQSRYARRDDLIETLRVGACARLEAFGASLHKHRVQLEVRIGDPASCLTLAAKEHDAELIIVGPHGERPGLWEEIGSEVEHLIRSSPLPVLVARGALDHAPRTILVAVDDWRDSVESLRCAAVLARKHGARVILMHVMRSNAVDRALAAAATVVGAPPMDAHASAFAAPARQGLAEALRVSGLPDQDGECEVAFGDPATELLAAVDRMHVDLLVVQRHEAGKVRRALLGSVVHEILQKSPCSVLIASPS